MVDYVLNDDGKFVPFVRPAKAKVTKPAAVKVVAPAIDSDVVEETSLDGTEGVKLHDQYSLDGTETNKDLKLMLDNIGVKYAKTANKEKLLELLAPFLIVVAVEEEPEL